MMMASITKGSGIRDRASDAATRLNVQEPRAGGKLIPDS
jgi:hypothetical protein